MLAHRLDKDTSGCLVLGRHRKATASLGLLFKHGKIAKTYWAVVEGGPAEDEGTIDLPLGRLNVERGWWQKPDPDGQKAVTNWKVLGRGDGLAWLAMEPVTGRTHQLRVHASAMGWPIVGDNIYGNGPRFGEPRLHLHSREIGDSDFEEQGAGARGGAGAGAYARAVRDMRLERGVVSPDLTSSVRPFQLSFTERSGLPCRDAGWLRTSAPIGSGRAMLNAERSIVDEVEAAINTGSAEKRLETARRVTDLFLASAGSFNNEQVELFDNVLERLIKTIEIRVDRGYRRSHGACRNERATRSDRPGAALRRPPPRQERSKSLLPDQSCRNPRA